MAGAIALDLRGRSGENVFAFESVRCIRILCIAFVYFGSHSYCTVLHVVNTEAYSEASLVATCVLPGRGVFLTGTK